MTQPALYNDESERCLLNSILINPSLMDRIAPFSKECFFNINNRRIYQSMCELWETKHFFDVIALTEYNKEIDPVYISTLTNVVPSAESWKYYASTLTDLYKKRELTKSANTLLKDAGNKNSLELIDELQSALANLDTSEVKRNSIKDLAYTAVEQVQKASKEKKLITGFECGFESLDRVLDGFQTGNMYILGARPSIGKTAFALELALGLASKGAKTTIFSLEMSSIALYYRMLSNKSDIPMWQIKKGFISESQRLIEKFEKASNQLFNLPIAIMDTGIDNDKVLYSRIRYEAKVKQSKVIFIDHLGLIEVSDSSGQRYVDVGRITKTLHKMARELDVCIIVLAQCGREAEGKKPNLSLLRESGNIEQDGDVIMLLHRQRELEDKEKDNPFREFPTDVIVAKNRDGDTGPVPFSFKPICMKFREDSNREPLEDGSIKPVYRKEKDNEIPY